MGFHRKHGPRLKRAGRWFSLPEKPGAAICFENWHDLATQDGTPGDSQRHESDSRKRTHSADHPARGELSEMAAARASIGRGDDGRIRGLVRQRRDRRTPSRAAHPGARRTDAVGYQTLARRIARRKAAELRVADHREGRDQHGARRVSARISSGGHCRQRVRLRSGLQPPWGLDIDAFLGAAHRRQRTDPWAHRPQQRVRSLRPRLPRERNDRPCATAVDDQRRGRSAR
jgi:hypothetical protein